MSDDAAARDQLDKGDASAARVGCARLREMFYLDEYRSLRDEIQRRAEHQIRTETYTLLACAAIYSFTITASSGISVALLSSMWMIWWVPVVLLIAGLIRWWSTHIIILRIAFYIRKGIEARVRGAHEPLSGWEHLQYDQRTGQKKYFSLWDLTFYLREITWTSTAAFWLLAIVIATAVAIWQTINPYATYAAVDFDSYKLLRR